jgi:hypothetical protein
MTAGAGLSVIRPAAAMMCRAVFKATRPTSVPTASAPATIFGSIGCAGFVLPAFFAPPARFDARLTIDRPPR